MRCAPYSTLGVSVGEHPVRGRVRLDVVTILSNGDHVNRLVNLNCTGRDDLTVDGVVNTGRGGDRQGVRSAVELRSGSDNSNTLGTLQNDSRLGLRQGTRQAGLHQVLVLVEVDVEVLEEGEVTTSVGTEVVVDQVDDDAEKVRLVLHDLNGLDLRHTKRGSKSGLSLVESTTHLVLLQEETNQVRVGRVERRVTRTTVLRTRTNDLLDLSLGLDVGRELNVDGVHLVIVENRADTRTIGLALGVLALVLVSSRTTITDEDSASKLLLKHEADLPRQPCDNVEVRDVDGVITVELRLLVEGRRTGRATAEADDPFLLQITPNVTLRTGLLSRQVSNDRLNLREGGALRSVEDVTNPLNLTSKELGLVGHRLGIGEQQLDVSDAIVLGVSEERVLERSHTDTVVDDSLDLRVRQSRASTRGLNVAVLLKNVCGHVRELLLDSLIHVSNEIFSTHAVFCGVIVVVVVSFSLGLNFADHVVHDILLLL